MLSFSSLLPTATLLAVLAVQPIGGCDSTGSSDHAEGGGVPDAPSPGGGPRPHPQGGRGGHPHGGTPEPATVLLVGGSVAGYLALRRRKSAAPMADDGAGGV